MRGMPGAVRRWTWRWSAGMGEMAALLRRHGGITGEEPVSYTHLPLLRRKARMLAEERCV